MINGVKERPPLGLGGTIDPSDRYKSLAPLRMPRGMLPVEQRETGGQVIVSASGPALSSS